MERSWSVVVGWVAVLVLGVAAGHALGAGALAVPGREVAAWRTWTATTDPFVVTMALFRVGALAVVWYLLATTALGVVARMLRVVRLVHLADMISAPVVRRVLQRGLGMMVATALASSVSAPAVQAAEPPPVAVLQGERSSLTMRGVQPGLDRRELDRPELDRAEVDDAPVATLPWHRLLGQSGDRSSDEELGTGGETQAQGMIRTGGMHTVRAGDSLWRIAEARLAAAWGRAPRDAEVIPYWRELIERNRDRLVVADDPDLIVPGQELVLPVVERP